MTKLEWKSITILANDLRITDETINTKTITPKMTYEQAHRILMDEYDKKYEEKGVFYYDLP